MNENDIYNNYAKLSYIDEKNFYGGIDPKMTSNLFINCSDMNNFYTDTYIYLHLYSSLFFELYKYSENNKSNNLISKFSNLIKNLKIKIENDTTNSSNIGRLDENNNIYTFNLNAVKNYVINNNINFNSNIIYSNQTPFISNTYTITSGSDSNIITNNYLYYINNENNYYKYTNNVDVIKYINPVLLNINNSINITENFNYLNNILNIDYTNITSKNKFNEIKSNSLNYSNNENRQQKLLKIINEILSQNHENILSYLLYYKIYFHVILYNIIIQGKFREFYLNSTINLNNEVDNTIKQQIINIFDNMRTNLEIINLNILNFKNNDYIKDKYEYTLKIANLNAIKDEYKKIENNLNNTIREYNKYIKNFKTIKTFGNFIIIFLIVIIIITILITILNSLSFNFKNYYYLGTFIILSIITYIYYNRFKYINLYERFELINNNICNNTIEYSSKRYFNKLYHARFYNDVLENMNKYNTKVKDTFDNIRTNIYTIGNKVFSQDANIYLYNLYKEKKQQNESNRIKQSSLSNMLETLRKRVVYLFNVILLISLLTLILLFGLLLYINFPFFLTYIVIVCIILLFIVIAYFMIAIVQPTRMVANKNYWANQNPSKNLLVKL